MRKYILGDEWLYLKIYSGPESVDSFLGSEVYSIVKKAAAARFIKNFYFVRYIDEDGHHLRLRFHLTAGTQYSELIDEINTKFRKHLREQIVHRIIYDTYCREIERYSPAYMDHAEVVFGISSWMIMKNLKRNADEDKRWAWGAGIMNLILSCLGLSNEEKHLVYEDYFQLYAREFGFSKDKKAILSKKYRDFSKEILEAVKALPARPTSLLQYIAATVPFLDEERVTKAFKHAMLTRNNYSLYTVEQKQIIHSLMHMHFNRLFVSQQRAAEYIIYFILSKVHKSLTILNSSK